MADADTQFDIPAQPVADALRAFAAQTEMQLLYQYEAVKDARASALVGHFGKAEALRQLLRGTGLEAVFSGDGAALIRPVRGPPARGGESRARRKIGVQSDDPAVFNAAQAPARRTAGHGAATNVDAASLEEITVTGSRIRRTGIDRLQPTFQIDRPSIEGRGLASIADVLAELPAFGPPGNSPVGGQSAVAVGPSFVNFLGLGSQRTLTLVDGRRFVAANTPSIGGATAPGLQVDLNTIPAALVERVEIAAVGGAPVYGADAIAGTVNIVRRRDLDGFDALLQVGETEQGGAGRRRAQGVYGRNFESGRGNVAASFEYAEQDGMRALDREATAAGLSFQPPADPLSPFRQVLVRDSRVVLVNFNGLPLTAPVANRTEDFRFAVQDGQGQPLQFAADGALVPFDPGTRTGSAVFASGGDGLDLAATTSLLTRSERSLANLFVTYDLSAAMSVEAEGWFARTHAQELVNQPPFNESSFRTPQETLTNVLQGPIPLRLDNPFLSDASRATIARAIDFDGDGQPDATLDFDRDGVPDTPGFWLAKGHQDLFRGGPSTSRQELSRGVLALRGASSLAGRAWDWDVSYNLGRVRSAATNPAILNREFNRAIDVLRDPATGLIRCRDTSDAACAPLNLFGFAAPSPEATAYVTATTTARSKVEQRVLSANASGSPFSLAGGVVRLAAGAEYRRESSAFDPDPRTSSGVTRGAPLSAISGSFHTSELYAETIVPLIGPQQRLSRAHALDLEGAVRFVEHSTAGSDLTWTAGLRFAPHSAVRLRGNYTESIRAPAITELFLPTTTIFALAADPCDRRFVNRGPNPQRRAANCALAGVIQPFSSRIVNATQPMTVEGNRELSNERASAWTVGLTLQSQRLPGLSVSLDWIDIRLRDAIERFDGSTVLQACYDSIDFPSAAVCRRFRRASDGEILDLRTGFLNAGVVDFAGLTGDVSYDVGLDHGGTLGLALRYFRLDRLDLSVTGTDFNPGAGELSNSRDRATAQLTYRNGAVRGVLHAQYIGPAVFDSRDGPADRDVRGVGAFRTIGAAFAYSLSDAASLQLNVDNVFDARPPFASMAGALGAGATSAPATYFPGLLGRAYALTARVQF